MRVRFRKLLAHTDPEALKSVRRARYGHGLVGSVMNEATARAEAPVTVDSTDAEADLEQVVEAVRRGALEPKDLVDVGEGWQSIEDCPLFFDVCERTGAYRSSKILYALGILLATFIAIGAGLVWLWAQTP